LSEISQELVSKSCHCQSRKKFVQNLELKDLEEDDVSCIMFPIVYNNGIEVRVIIFVQDWLPNESISVLSKSIDRERFFQFFPVGELCAVK
jgi:hypothetical protein